VVGTIVVVFFTIIHTYLAHQEHKTRLEESFKKKLENNEESPRPVEVILDNSEYTVVQNDEFKGSFNDHRIIKV